jgi:hypothetical protein
MMIGWMDYTIDGQNLRAQGQTPTTNHQNKESSYVDS